MQLLHISKLLLRPISWFLYASFSYNLFRREIIEYLSGIKAELPVNYDHNLPPAIPITFERIRTVGEPAAKKIKLEPRQYAPIFIQLDFICYREKEVTLRIKTELSEGKENVPLRQLNNDLTIDKYVWPKDAHL